MKAPEEIPATAFDKLPVAEQAAKCPAAVATELDSMEESAHKAVQAAVEKQQASANTAAEKAVAGIIADEQKALKAAKTDEEKARARVMAFAAGFAQSASTLATRESLQRKLESVQAAGKEFLTAAKASYARWVYGVDKRPAKLKSITGRDDDKGEVMMTAPQRLELLEWQRRMAKEAAGRQVNGLGNGTGTDSKRVAEFRMDAVSAEANLARDANAFVAELKKDLNGGKEPDALAAEPSRGQQLDRVTMWFLVVVGACLMGGLFTRVACVFAAGFLVMTYLAHPPFPWFPQPPNTEGNPVFINKNVIEALALLTLACYPTGRWLGLDALVLRPFRRYERDPAVA